jgi:hypothetical protein
MSLHILNRDIQQMAALLAFLGARRSQSFITLLPTSKVKG